MTKTRDEVVELMALAAANLRRSKFNLPKLTYADLKRDEPSIGIEEEMQAAYDALLSAGVIRPPVGDDYAELIEAMSDDSQLLPHAVETFIKDAIRGVATATALEDLAFAIINQADGEERFKLQPDERKYFERLALSKGHSVASTDGQYDNRSTELLWEFWEARATLSNKPAMGEDDVQIVAKNTLEDIQRYKDDQRPASVYCKRCNLKAMLTIEQLNDHVERCKLCRS